MCPCDYPDSDSAHHLGLVQSKSLFSARRLTNPIQRTIYVRQILGLAQTMASARSERSDKNSVLSAECSAWFTLLSTLGATILAPAGNLQFHTSPFTAICLIVSSTSKIPLADPVL